MTTENTQRKTELHSAIVWLLAGFSLVIYCIIGLFNTSIPGVEQLVSFLSSVEKEHIYIAAFLSIFIEGLYVVGSFFPGSTLVVILAILSQLAGVAVFIGTILTVFIGWCLAGVVNILIAKTYHSKIAQLEEKTDYHIQDRLWTTWFPAFRANYEVAQITDGGNPFKVFLSSVRVKFWSCIFATLYALIIPFFININEISNKEGFMSAMVVALISFIVGSIKLKKYFNRT